MAANDFCVSLADVLHLVNEDDDLELIELTGREALLWDNRDTKFIPVHFLECMDMERLMDLIKISPDLPYEFRINKRILAEYLWNVCDRDAFLTLNEIVVIWSEHFEVDEDFTDTELKRLQEEYADDYALSLSDGFLGMFWFERNIVVINMGEIVRTSAKIVEENKDLHDAVFSFEHQILVGLLTTAIHELRHLQLDGNIFLPEDKYPLALADEYAVEEYCRDVFERNSIPSCVLPNIGNQ